MDLCLWKALKDDCLASKASSILVDWNLDRRLQERSSLGGIQHLRLGALSAHSPFEDTVRDNLKLLEREINSSKQLELRTLFLEDNEHARPDDSDTTLGARAMRALSRTCRSRGVRVVYDDFPSGSEQLWSGGYFGPVISPAFWEIQQEIKRGRVVGISERA